MRQCAVPCIGEEYCSSFRESLLKNDLVDQNSVTHLDSDQGFEEMDFTRSGHATRWADAGDSMPPGSLVMPMRDGETVGIDFLGEWPTAEEVKTAVKDAGYDDAQVKATQESIEKMMETVNRLNRKKGRQ